MNKNETDAAALRRAYHKQWRDRNKDKVKQYNKNFWEKKALEARQGGAAQ